MKCFISLLKHSRPSSEKNFHSIWNIEKCIQNEIILSEERIYGYSTPFPVYAVKFNDLFDPSFKELPDNVKKYFEKLQNIDDMEF